MLVEIEISDEKIANLFCSFVESGDPVTTAVRGGWCAGVFPAKGEPAKRAKKLKHWYAEEVFWRDGAAVEVLEVEDESKPWDIRLRKNVIVHLIDRAKIRAAFAIMAKKYGHLFSRIVNDNGDAPCADILVQCACFGEEKYA